MAVIQIPLYGNSSQPLANGNTAASPNTLVLRDSSGNIVNVGTQQNTLTTTNTIVNPTPVSQTASFTAAVDSDCYQCDATSGAIVVTLPAVAGCTGREYTIVKIDSGSNHVTPTGNGSENINGANTYVLSSQWQKVKIRSDGAKWLVIGT